MKPKAVFFQRNGYWYVADIENMRTSCFDYAGGTKAMELHGWKLLKREGSIEWWGTKE